MEGGRAKERQRVRERCQKLCISLFLVLFRCEWRQNWPIMQVEGGKAEHPQLYMPSRREVKP